MKVQSIYTSRIFKRGLEFAANNGTLFASTATLGFSALRTLVILATPNTNKENRQIASTKSASGLVGFLLMLGVSLPVASAVKNIDDNPSKFLKKSTIQHLKGGEKALTKSSKYSFATQLIKLGLGGILAVPKSILTSVLIPPVMYILFRHRNKITQPNPQTLQSPTFTGSKLPKDKVLKNVYQKFIESLSEKLGKFIDLKPVQNLADKFHKTKFEQHMISITDTLATLAFAAQTAKSKKIKDNDKKLLIYNSLISTGLSIGGMYAIDGMTKNSTEKFIEKFKKANINSPKLDKYVEGIRIVKPLMILGALYYIAIPMLSTYFADKVVKTK